MTAPAPLRVLALSSHGQDGGSEVYLLRLLDQLRGEVDPHVVVLEDGPLAADLDRHGLRTAVVPSGRRLGLAVAAARVRRLIAHERPDVVHANGVKAATVAAVALAGRPEPLLWVKHDHSWDGRLGRAVARRAALVVGVSTSAIQAVRDAAPTLVVPPGVAVPAVDRAEARALARELAGAGPDDPVLVVAGRLDPAKGFDTAIGVLAALRAVHPSARLVVAGGADPSHPGVGAALAERATDLDVGDAVTFVGRRDDVPALLAGADVVLVTSRAVDGNGMGREGFGLVAAEALLVGTPVVGFADGATPEVVGGAGLLVPPGNLPAMTEAVRRVLDEPGLRDRLRVAAAERAGRYDVDRWAAEMLDVYRRLQLNRRS